jgi:hypothetical protein
MIHVMAAPNAAASGYGLSQTKLLPRPALANAIRQNANAFMADIKSDQSEISVSAWTV